MFCIKAREGWFFDLQWVPGNTHREAKHPLAHQVQADCGREQSASLTPAPERANRRVGGSLCLEVAMKAKLGPGRNESQAGGWMSVDSGQVQAAVGFWGQSFWQVGVQETLETGLGF